MVKRILMLIVLSFNMTALAFHTVDCHNVAKNFTASYISDASFGFIIRANMNYNSQRADYAFSGHDINHVKNHVAFISFPSGETLIIGKGENTAVAFNKMGEFVTVLACSMQ